jgi:formylglycine-generating enzyme required for sulfatase activity
MNKTYLILLIIVLLTAGCSSSKTFRAPKGFQFIPPGEYSVKNDSIEKTYTINAFWMSGEITNKEFRDFVTDLQLNPDSAVFWVDLKQASSQKSEEGNEENYSYYYKRTYSAMLENILTTSLWANSKECANSFYDEKSDDFPVVGINYRAAKDYCLWRSIKDKQINNNHLIEYRLPLEIEWEYAASGFTPDDENITLIKANKGKKNPFGLRNINSNVAEFVNSENSDDFVIIKGSSWRNSINPNERVSVDPDFRNDATGFRIVMSFVGRRK